MDRVADLAGYVGAATFAGVAAAGVIRTRRGAPAGARAAIAFGALAIVLGISALLPDTTELPPWFEKVLVVLFVAFPYLLYRFTEAFHSYSSLVRAAVLAGTVGAVGTTLALPDLSGEARQTGWVRAYVAVLLAYWVGLSVISALQLWRAGKGHPTLTRRRMRLMSLATCGLSVGLVVVGLASPDSAAAETVFQVMVAVSAICFLLGFSPPKTLRYAWREREQEESRAAIGELMRATTVREVTSLLLPHVIDLVGGSAAAVMDAEGQVVASVSENGSPSATSLSRGPGSNRNSLKIPLRSAGFSSLVVWTSPYTPFFGRDDVETLRGLAAVADLAFERCRLLQSEREARAAAELARESAERANLAKSEFLSRMSHELRTPLNVILGFSQVLETSDLSKEDLEAVSHMIKAGRHLLDLINEVLDIARIESGHMTTSPEPVRADELVGETLDLIRPSADERGIEILAQLSGNEAYVRADRQRLKQVLLNILSNAVKYNRDHGKINVSFTVGSDRLRISVRDTGPGIPEAYMSKLFEPFQRLGAEQGLVEGTGLGLTLSRQLMEVMGGTLNVANFHGEGAEFSIELPVVERPGTRIGSSHEPAESQHAEVAEQQRTILLIEDNLSNLHLIERILKRRPGIGLMPAMKGSLGLELAREHDPDLILLDLHLPDLSGSEVLHRLRADPRTRDVPVVVVSADASTGQVQRLLDAGAEGYLTKPLELDRFLEMLDSMLFTKVGDSGSSLSSGDRAAPGNRPG